MHNDRNVLLVLVVVAVVAVLFMITLVPFRWLLSTEKVFARKVTE